MSETYTSEDVGALKSIILNKANELQIDLNPDDLTLLQVDWNSILVDNDKIEIEGQEYVTLAGLRRLARMRGYLSSRPRVVQVPEYENHRNATVEWEIVWKDGSIDGACADASWRTVNPGFRNFPVAIASNRAEARAIRAALGIETCSYEEIGPQDEDLSGPSNDQQKSAILMLMKRRKINSDNFAEFFGDTIASKVVQGSELVLKDLTHQEAIGMMAQLNKPSK